MAITSSIRSRGRGEPDLCLAKGQVLGPSGGTQMVKILLTVSGFVLGLPCCCPPSTFWEKAPCGWREGGGAPRKAQWKAMFGAALHKAGLQ